MKNLSEKLASVLVDCPAKDDDSMASQAKKGQEAIAGDFSFLLLSFMWVFGIIQLLK